MFTLFSILGLDGENCFWYFQNFLIFIQDFFSLAVKLFKKTFFPDQTGPKAQPARASPPSPRRRRSRAGLLKESGFAPPRRPTPPPSRRSLPPSPFIWCRPAPLLLVKRRRRLPPLHCFSCPSSSSPAAGDPSHQAAAASISRRCAFAKPRHRALLPLFRADE